jgi:serine/threonine protein kinase
MDNKDPLQTSEQDPQLQESNQNGSGTVSPEDKTVLLSEEDDATRVLADPESAPEGPTAPTPDIESVEQAGAQSQQMAGSDDATVLREPQEDETILREPAADDDATILNVDVDDDATVISDNEPRGDSTYIASVGTQHKKTAGSSDAGRLLKNRFVLEQKIGSGGMADVYKALDLRQQEARDRNPYVAIKILKEDFAKHKDAFISLQREASKTRGMPHKNIMAVYDFDVEGDTVFMAMELLTGEPLDDYLKRHPEGLEREIAWSLTRDICEGLIMAHSKNIVHSDFKPGNIYFTEENTAKILDFGIARAAENPGESSGGGDETVFDAGSLGALTPTYASYEMLTGQTPTKSDDVFAVALVAYEMFTGKHPYGRTPADKALERGLVPERIPFMKRRHWKALLKGLAIKNEDRTQTMEEFLEGMFSEDFPFVRYGVIGVVASAIIGYGAYTQLTEGPVQDEALIGAQQALDLRKEDFRELLTDSTFTAQWEEDIREGLDDINDANESLMKDYSQLPDPDLPSYQNRVQQLYAEEVQRLRQQYEQEIDQPGKELDPADLLATAQGYLETMKNQYNFDPQMSLAQDGSLKLAIRTRDSERKRDAAEKERQRQEELRLAREAKNKAESEARAQQQENEYNQTMAALTEQMKCKKTFKDKDGMAGSVKLLQEKHAEKFALVREDILAGMAKCITKNRIQNPDAAKGSRLAVMAMFPGERSISSIKIQARDACRSRSLVGKGARNKKCQDPLQFGGKGPELVVIPKSKDFNVFAIGKTELKIGEYNVYCKETGCQQLTGSNSLPATNLSIEQINSYLNWISEQSGRSYRLPTVAEWHYAASTNKKESVNVNVNCTVNSRGVRLGDKLVKTLSGKPNGWGLYHHIGNAQELAVEGEGFAALGGAHTDAKKECTVDKKIAHTGTGDAVTGIRVYRQI